MPRQALGLPNPQEYGDLTKLNPGQLVDWIVHRHAARRAGLHRDVRFGTPDTGLFSWATRKELPEPGQKHLAIRQPLHSHDYGQFTGEIAAGYGAGTVSHEDVGKVLLTKVSPESIHFTLAHRRYPERFVLLKPKMGDDKKWLMINVTPNKPVPYEKVRYTKVEPEKVESIIEKLGPGASTQAKIDGAASLTTLLKDKIEVVSYRASKVHGGPILHTERVFHTVPKVNVPKDLVGTVLRGELYGQRERDGQHEVIPPQELGGILNSSVQKSIERQKDQHVRLRQLIFDADRIGKQRIDPDKVPYQERLGRVHEILSRLGTDGADVLHQSGDSGGYSPMGLGRGTLHGPEVTGEASTVPDAKQLWHQIVNKQNPYTTEGVVIHPPTGKPMKSKLMDEHDVHIRGFFPGQGKYKDNAVGGFVYSHTPTGPIVGEVGTGFSDQTRRDMWENQESYTGRIAKVRSQTKLPSGALRAPAFLALHEDYPLAKVGEIVKEAMPAAVASTLSQLNRGLSTAGRGLSTAGRGLATAGRSGLSAVSRGGRAVGSGAISLANASREPLRQLGNKTVESLKYTGGMKPDQTWKSMSLGDKAKTVAKSMFAPNYPGIEPAAQRLLGDNIAGKLFKGIRTMPWVGAGIGTGYGAVESAQLIPDNAVNTARELGITDKETLDKIWWNGLKESPSMAWRTFAPGWLGGDTSAVGDIHRDMFWKSSLPGVQHGFYRARQDRPWLFKTIDALRSVTPAGAAQTQLVNALASDTPLDHNKILRDVLLANKDKALNDVGATANSPLARSWANILTNTDKMQLSPPPVLADLSANKVYDSLGAITGPAKQHLADAGVSEDALWRSISDKLSPEIKSDIYNNYGVVRISDRTGQPHVIAPATYAANKSRSVLQSAKPIDATSMLPAVRSLIQRPVPAALKPLFTHPDVRSEMDKVYTNTVDAIAPERH